MDMEIISEYTDDDGVEDGILVRLEKDGKPFSRTINLATVSLLASQGYMDEDNLNVPNVMDLVCQGEALLWRYRKNHDLTLVAGEIESPKGEQIKVLIAQNMSDGFTIMLPSDY